MQHEYRNEQCTIRVSLGGTGEPATIVWMQTNQGMWNRGYAKDLLQHIIDAADNEHVPLRVNITQANPGVDKERLAGLFRSFGFKNALSSLGIITLERAIPTEKQP